MARKEFKVRDTVTGLYWNGSTYGSLSNQMTKDGYAWDTKNKLLKDLQYYVRGLSNYWSLNKTSEIKQIPPTWQIEEFELVPVSKGSTHLGTYSQNIEISAELEKVNKRYRVFYEQMIKKDVADKIEFIIELKGTGKRYGYAIVSSEDKKEARAALRLLGVKARTYKEYDGMFGMMDRAQAMKARLTMDPKSVIDVGEIRNKVLARRNTATN